MVSNADGARKLGAELQRLVDSERSDTLHQWYQKSVHLEQRILKGDDGMCSNLVSNFIWDWLADADARRKDSEIAAEQGREIREAISELSRGVWPG